MKAIHIVFALLMLSFAALQWNDPDRVIWISIYLATALMACLVYYDICNPCLQAWAILFCLITFIMILLVFPGVIEFIQNSNLQEIFSTMSDEKIYIEQTREFLGLLITLSYCIYIVIKYYKQ